MELSRDARFRGRVTRLAATSVVGLGAIAALSRATLDAPAALDAGLVAGWVLMPVLLGLSLRRPLLRYALVVPSGLVGGALVAMLVLALPEEPLAWTGWLLVTAGVAFGGLLGLWFWYRLLPVPQALGEPFSRWRWALIALHVGLIVAGLVAVLAASAR